MTDTKWVVGETDNKFGCREDQVWMESSDGFTGISFGGKRIDVGSSDAELLGARYCSACSPDKKSLPGNFEFCPDCGSETKVKADRSTSKLGHWPSFNGTGWSEHTEQSSGFDDRREITVPGGDWALLVAGSPPALIMFDYENGKIVRPDGQSGWAHVSRVSTPHLQPWQRSLIASPIGLYFPTEQNGLGFLPTPFVQGVRSVFSNSNDVNALSGPGLLDGHVLLPVKVGETIKLIGSPLSSSPARDTDCWVQVDIEDRTDLAPEAFGAPFSNEAGDLFWVGEKSYLVIASGEDDWKPKRLRWREGFIAHPIARPYRSRRGGSAWQLGHIETAGNAGEGEAAFHLVSRSQSRQEIKSVDGPHLSFGSGTFRGDKRFEEPWIEHVTDYDPSSDNSIFIPICTFGSGDNIKYVVAVAEGREHLTDLLSRNGASSIETRLHCLGRLLGSMNALGAAFHVQGLHDISAVIFEQRLFVYGRCENRVMSWRINP